MSQDGVIPVANNAKSRNDLIERGFSRQPLRIDVDVARSLEALAHAAWSIPKDKYYDGGDRYRSLNRAVEKIQHDSGRPAARVCSAALGNRCFYGRSQDDCSPPSLPTAVGGGDAVLGQRPPNKVHGYAGSTDNGAYSRG
jgi:hypothetical protein